LWSEHRDMMKSSFADLRNINSPGQGAGTIAGAAFLAPFADGVPWVHLDIAGTAWGGRATDYAKGGATGVGVRLLAELVRSASMPNRGKSQRKAAKRPRARR
jgi:leucyl aminopeptidase